MLPFKPNMDRNRVIIGFLVLILLVLGVFAYGSTKRTATKTVAKPINLTDYASQNITLRLTTEGPISADEKHSSSTIAVGSDGRSFSTYKTYNQTPAQSQTYTNNQAAFEDFLYAMQRNGFTKTNTKAAADKDTRGYCPNGNRYTYELIQNDQVTLTLWSSSCNLKQQTFAGNGATIRALFKAQIPDYNKIVAASH